MEQSAQLKLLQEIELENLRMLMEICEKNHLRYYLIGGSLLGAMRHGGFIPWDDDIDVGLPRPDYNRFVQIAKDYLPAHMDIKTMTSDPNYKCYFTRLINKIEEVTECYNISGSFDYLLRIQAPDMKYYQQFLLNVIGHHENIATIQSTFVMEEIKHLYGVSV